MSIAFIIFLIVFLALLIPTAYAAKIGAPYAPTFAPAIRRVFDYVRLGSEDTIVDLGAGDGKVLLLAAERGAAAVGYELSPIMWLVTWLRLTILPIFTHRVCKNGGLPPDKGGLRGVRRSSTHQACPRIHLRNFYKTTLPPQTTVIFAFLMPENMTRVQRYLAEQNLPTLRSVIVYSFPFPNITPEHIVHTPKCGRMFVYDPSDLTKQS